MSLLGPDNMSKKHLTICLPDKTSADPNKELCIYFNSRHQNIFNQLDKIFFHFLELFCSHSVFNCQLPVFFSSSERPKLNFSNSKMVKMGKNEISLKASLLVLFDWKYVLGASLSRLVLSGAIRAPQDDFVNPSFGWIFVIFTRP